MKTPSKAEVAKNLLMKLGRAYGLELVEESKGRLKRGTVYVVLQRLAETGMVDSEPDNKGRRIFWLTEAGRQNVWDARDSFKERARRAIYCAIKSGKITRLPCMVCGIEPAEAHHPDYTKPLEVEFLCRQHHNALHDKEGARWSKEKEAQALERISPELIIKGREEPELIDAQSLVLEAIDDARVYGARAEICCEVLGVSVRTVERWRARRTLVLEKLGEAGV